MLKRPSYIEDQDGAVTKVFCKSCGVQIAGVVAKPKGSGPNIGKLVEAFKRFPNYAEIKMVFDDKTFHVTNGCKGCLNMGLSVETLFELYHADMATMQQKPGRRKPLKVVAIDMAGVGLV